MTKKINIIFDLDHTLVHTILYDFCNCKNNIDNSISGIIKNKDYIAITFFRPFIFELLNYCFEYYNVSFWTSGSYTYCIKIINLILSEIQYENTNIILATYDNKHIIDIKTDKLYTQTICKPFLYKPLELLWKDNKLKNVFNINNTIIIDDNIFVYKYNIKNALLIEKYNYLNKNDSALFILLNILKFKKLNIGLLNK